MKFVEFTVQTASALWYCIAWKGLALKIRVPVGAKLREMHGAAGRHVMDHRNTIFSHQTSEANKKANSKTTGLHLAIETVTLCRQEKIKFWNTRMHQSKKIEKGPWANWMGPQNHSNFCMEQKLRCLSLINFRAVMPQSDWIDSSPVVQGGDWLALAREVCGSTLSVVSPTPPSPLEKHNENFASENNKSQEMNGYPQTDSWTPSVQRDSSLDCDESRRPLPSNQLQSWY